MACPVLRGIRTDEDGLADIESWFSVPRTEGVVASAVLPSGSVEAEHLVTFRRWELQVGIDFARLRHLRSFDRETRRNVVDQVTRRNFTNERHSCRCINADEHTVTRVDDRSRSR